MFVFPGQEERADVENRRVPAVREGRWVTWETAIGTYTLPRTAPHACGAVYRGQPGRSALCFLKRCVSSLLCLKILYRSEQGRGKGREKTYTLEV